MTQQQMQPVAHPSQPLTGQIMTPADVALIGGQLGAAGYTQVQIGEIMGMVEREAFAAAQEVARRVSMAVMSKMTEAVQRVHTNAAMEIHRQLSNEQLGFGGLLAHRKCAAIALNVANTAPRQMPPPPPIIGSVR
jgi:hypothetical protein